MIKGKFKKSFIICLSILIVVCFGFLIFGIPDILAENTATISTKPVDASGSFEGIAKFLTWVVMLFVKLVGSLLTIFISMVIGIFGFNQFVDSRAVAMGWVIVRDLVNIFFVIIMLLIAFGTLFNVETYQYKKLLPKLVIAAIMVNFSKMIVGVAIDIGQVVMMTFVHAFEAVAVPGFVNALGIQNMLRLRDTIEAAGEAGDINYWSIFGAVALALIMLIIAAVVILTMVIVLLFRIIMLWVLVIFSPFAFIASVLPTSPLQKVGFFAQYWAYLSKYIIVGPILAFFLWLSFGILQQINQDTGQHAINLAREEDPADKPSYAKYLASEISSPQNMFDYMTTIALLIGSLVITQQMGVMGGNFGMSAVNKMKGMAQKGLVSAAKWTAKKPFQLAAYGERKFYKQTGLSIFNPVRLYKKYKEYGQEQKIKDEIEGQKVGGEKAEAAFEKGHTRWGMARMALGSPQDFGQYYLGWHGVKRMGRTLVGTEKTGQEALAEAKEKSETMGEFLLRMEGAKKINPIEEAKKARFEKEKEDWVNSNLGDYQRGGSISYLDKEGKVVVQDIASNEKRVEAIARQELSQTVDNWSNIDKATQDKMVVDRLTEYKAMQGVSVLKDKEGQIKSVKEMNVENAKGFAQTKFDSDELLKTGINASIDKISRAQLKQEGMAKIDADILAKQKQADGLEKGGLSVNQVKLREGELNEITEQLKKLKAEFAKAKPGSIEQTRIIDTMQKLNRKQRAIKDFKTGEWVISDDEKKKNIDANIDKDTGKFIGEAKELRDGITKLQGAKLREAGNLTDMNSNPLKSGQQINKAIEQLSQEKRAMSEVAVAPRAFFASNAYRLLESDAMSKLPKESMEATELNSLIEDAVKQKDKPMLSVLLKKAAQDYNDNEFLNYYGETSNAEGMGNFMNKVLIDKAGMSKQMATQLLNEIGYINESKGHYETARLAQVEKGIMRLNTEAEHAAIVANENLKQPSRTWLQNTNRLGWGGETASGDYKMALSGKLTLMGFQDDIIYRLGRGEYNKSAFQKIVMEQLGEIKELENMGLITARDKEGRKLSQVLEKMKKELTLRGVYADYSSLRAQAELLKAV